MLALSLSKRTHANTSTIANAVRSVIGSPAIVVGNMTLGTFARESVRSSTLRRLNRPTREG